MINKIKYTTATALVALLPLNSTAAVGNSTCYPLFEKTKAIPGEPSCRLTASTANVGMGSSYCTATITYINDYCGDLCYSSVAKLGQLDRPAGATSNGFINNQTCIAKDACINKSTLQNQKWLDAVVPDFVDPLIRKSGQWPQVLQNCKFLSSGIPQFIREKWCEGHMAKYHIENDLQNSLNKNGCGTESDWNSIGTVINKCVKDANPIPGMGNVANQIVQYLRDSVRASCIAHRTQNNLPIESN